MLDIQHLEEQVSLLLISIKSGWLDLNGNVPRELLVPEHPVCKINSMSWTKTLQSYNTKNLKPKTTEEKGTIILFQFLNMYLIFTEQEVRSSLELIFNERKASELRSEPSLLEIPRFYTPKKVMSRSVTSILTIYI